MNDKVLQHSLVKKYISLVEPEGYSKRDSIDLASNLEIPKKQTETDIPLTHSSVSPLTASDTLKEPTHSENQELALIIQHLRQTEYDFIVIALHNNVPIIEGLLARLTIPMLVIKCNGDKKQFEDQVAALSGKLSAKDRFLRKIGLKKNANAANFVELNEVTNNKEKEKTDSGNDKATPTMTDTSSTKSEQKEKEKESSERHSTDEKEDKFPVEPLILED